jgi:arginine decarboxylase
MKSNNESLGRSDNLWSLLDSEELYRVKNWGDPYFKINDKGHMSVCPILDNKIKIDIENVIKDLRRKKTSMPILLRFLDILGSQVKKINQAFISAIDESGYMSEYRSVYPIKVNQFHEVVEELLDAGAKYDMGLECGSKAELVACLAHLEENQTLLICNGYKDITMLSLIIDAQILGKNVLPIVERIDEYHELMKTAKTKKFLPKFGLRMRLATSGSGRWAASSGLNSKFGLTMPEVISIIEDVERSGNLNLVKAVHAHIGSQISDIQVLKQATKELCQIYCELMKLGAGIEYVDVGGGLGIDYDETVILQEPSINYGMQEYANTIVYGIKEVCDFNKVSVPIIISESGRALTAHHSVLIVPVLDTQVRETIKYLIEPGSINNESLSILNSIYLNAKSLTILEELIESYHDASEKLNELKSLFSLGYLSLKERSLADQLFWSICRVLFDKLNMLNLSDESAELSELRLILTDQILCDFSVFQSMLDHWAIGQAFPIVPISSLEMEPTQRGVIMDLTCDSDGKIHRYVTNENDPSFIPFHLTNGKKPYYLGFFLMGAYNDSMGDSHNLFGRVNEAHIYCDKKEKGNYWIEKIIPGTNIKEMLNQVQYFPSDLQKRMNKIVKNEISSGKIKASTGIQILDAYMKTFDEMTYAKYNI